MKKMNWLLALMLGLLVSFTACSSDDDDDDVKPGEEEVTPPTEEEEEVDPQEQLLADITANFEAITSKTWSYKEFQPSDDMVASSETEDGYVALTAIENGNYAKNFNFVLTFVAQEDGLYKPTLAINMSDEEVDAGLQAYQDDLFPDFAGMEFFLGKESTLATFRRVIAAPLAADDLAIDDITSEETGLCIFTIAPRDFSDLSYDDMVLAQRQLIAGNDDKIYINLDGTLTIETTSTEFGVSKVILEEITE